MAQELNQETKDAFMELTLSWRCYEQWVGHGNVRDSGLVWLKKINLNYVMQTTKFLKGIAVCH